MRRQRRHMCVNCYIVAKGIGVLVVGKWVKIKTGNSKKKPFAPINFWKKKLVSTCEDTLKLCFFWDFLKLLNQNSGWRLLDDHIILIAIQTKQQKNQSLFNSSLPPEGVFKPINFFCSIVLYYIVMIPWVQGQKINPFKCECSSWAGPKAPL